VRRRLAILAAAAVLAAAADAQEKQPPPADPRRAGELRLRQALPGVLRKEFTIRNFGDAPWRSRVSTTCGCGALTAEAA
jgi:hypothetical protein